MPGAYETPEYACNTGDPGSIPEVGKILWRKEWPPTPVFLPGEFHGQRSLAGYRLWNLKELDTTEGLRLSLFSGSKGFP